MSYPDGIYPSDDTTWWIAKGECWTFVASDWGVLIHQVSEKVFRSLIGPYWTKEEAQRMLDKWS